MDRARWKSAAAPLVITVAACLATRLPARPEPGRGGGSGDASHAREDAPPATPEVTALLDGLRAGDALADFRVRRVSAPRDREIAVDLENAGLEVTITVALRGAIPHSSPRSTVRYDLFYGSARPPGQTLSPEDINSVLAALAERIARVEERVPTPSGM